MPGLNGLKNIVLLLFSEYSKGHKSLLQKASLLTDVLNTRVAPREGDEYKKRAIETYNKLYEKGTSWTQDMLLN